MKNLQLSLKKQWFEMTKAGIKTEDYREITPYWCGRLLLWNGRNTTRQNWENRLNDDVDKTVDENIIQYINCGWIFFKQYKTNTMTLGYPSSTDTKRILKLEHKGIEIRSGNLEWGAEEGKIYFIIKHGKRL